MVYLDDLGCPARSHRQPPCQVAEGGAVDAYNKSVPEIGGSFEEILSWIWYDMMNQPKLRIVFFHWWIWDSTVIFAGRWTFNPLRYNCLGIGRNYWTPKWQRRAILRSCGLWVLHVDLSPWPLADAGTGSTSPRKSPEGYRVQEGDLVVKVNGVAATWRYYFGLFPPKKQALLWRFRHSKHPADQQLRGLTL